MIWLYVKSTKLCDIWMYVSYRRHWVSRPRVGSVPPHLDCPANESADHRTIINHPLTGGWELGPQASQCYTGFSHRPKRLVSYASQGLLPHISHRSPSFQGISPGSPIKGLPSVEIGVTQPQTDAGTKCFEYIYTFLYDSFNCGTINYLKIIDRL